MLVRYFVELIARHEAVETALVKAERDWLKGMLKAAGDNGERLMVEVGFGGAIRLDRKVLVDIGQPQRVESKMLLPISWQPASGHGLLPAMDGDIEVAPVGENRTQLAVMMQYTPPFGLAGKVADRALLHRVAEATAKDFLVGVARRIEERLLFEQFDGAGTPH
jgi:hypothetical protein